MNPSNYPEDSLIYRLLKRAEIRRSIPTRKSVQEGKPDRIADLLVEAADTIATKDSYINYLQARCDLYDVGYVNEISKELYD